MKPTPPGFLEKAKHTYKRIFGAVGAVGVAGTAAWLGPGLMAAAAVPPVIHTMAGYLAAAKAKFLQHKHLVHELGEAQRYIYAVEKWMAAASSKFCQDNLRRILVDVKANVNALLHQSSGHFIVGIDKYDAELAALIREGQIAVDGNKDSYDRWVKNLYQWGTNYWWSDYYRADLSAHMIKLIEAVEGGIMAMLADDNTCPPIPHLSDATLNPDLQHDFDVLLRKLGERDSAASDFSHLSALSTPMQDEEEASPLSPPKLERQFKMQKRVRAKPIATKTPSSQGGRKRDRRSRTPIRKSVTKRRRSQSKRKSRA